MSEYWRLKREAREADGYWLRTLGLQSPWQNDHQPIARDQLYGMQGGELPRRSIADDYTAYTKLGHRAHVDLRRWNRSEFAYLGWIILEGVNNRVPWAWHADGRSIDREDRGFDLVNFAGVAEQEADKPYHWLGRDAEALA